MILNASRLKHLLRGCCLLNAWNDALSKRPTCAEALAHPYLADLHTPNDEPECKTPFSYVTEDLPVDEIWRQIDQETKLILEDEDQ